SRSRWPRRVSRRGTDPCAMLPTTTDVTPARRQRCRQLSTARRQEFAFRVEERTPLPLATPKPLDFPHARPQQKRPPFVILTKDVLVPYPGVYASSVQKLSLTYDTHTFLDSPTIVPRRGGRHRDQGMKGLDHRIGHPTPFWPTPILVAVD